MMFGYGGTGGWPIWAVALMWIGMLTFLGVLIWVGYTLMTSANPQVPPAASRWSARPRAPQWRGRARGAGRAAGPRRDRRGGIPEAAGPDRRG
jgi:hypothetical protein